MNPIVTPSGISTLLVLVIATENVTLSPFLRSDEPFSFFHVKPVKAISYPVIPSHGFVTPPCCPPSIYGSG